MSMTALEYASKVENWQDCPGWREEALQILGALGLPRGRRVLDFGCASGRMMDLIRAFGWSPTGIERNPIMRADAKRGDPWAPVYRSITDMLTMEQDPTFDGIVLSHVLGHVENPVELVAHLMSLCRPGGSVVVVVPNTRYDRLMAVQNRITGYRDDPTLRHQLSLANLHLLFDPWSQPDPEVFYMGEKPRGLGWVTGQRHRSRLGVVFTKV